nr:kinesin-like protein KIFC2 isoform X9 [Bubalus bubalis]
MDSKSQGQAGPVPGDAACLRGAAPSSCWIPIARRKPFPFTKGRGPGTAASSAGGGPEGLAAAGTAHPWTAGRAEAAAGTSGGGAGSAAPGSGSNRLREKGSASDSGEQSPETELEPYSGPPAALGPCPPHQGPPGGGRSPAGAPEAASRSPRHHRSPPSPGLRARMASLRQGCGDLRGLVSTFTQSCQGSLSEAQGQDLGGSPGPDLHPRKHPCAVSAEARDTLQPGELRARPGWHCYHLLSRAPASLPPRLGLPSARQPRGDPGSWKAEAQVPAPATLLPTHPLQCTHTVQLELPELRNKAESWEGEVRGGAVRDQTVVASQGRTVVFRELESAVLSCLGGYSVCIFTYGQTGTGKTYSMEGPPEDPGIAPRALQSLFREMGTGGQHRVTLSMVEIYNEAVRALPFFTRDLLAPGPPQRLAVRQGPAGQGGIQVAGLTHWDVPNLESLHQMLSLGRSNRATAATAMNQRSSRSHALVTLTLRTASPSRGPGTAGTLHLVDLAGSERAWKAGTAGTSQEDRDGAQRLREARTINRSLLALGGVMAALRARRPHVPFRDSQLTRLLQPALGPGATVVLLLQVGWTAGGEGGDMHARRRPPGHAHQRRYPQISTRPEDLGETVCSLKFAERVGRVELGPARPRRAPRSGTPSSLSTDTPLSGTPCTPTPSPGSPPSPGLDSGSSSALAPPEDLPS